MTRLTLELQEDFFKKLKDLSNEFCRTPEQEAEYRIKQGMRIPGHIPSDAIELADIDIAKIREEEFDDIEALENEDRNEKINNRKPLLQ